jgi:hypothetical protein
MDEESRQMMTRASAGLDAVELCRARNRLHSVVRAMLAGSGLEIRDRRRGLAITNPGDRDRGRIYINYVTGEVSWQQSTWIPSQSRTYRQLSALCAETVVALHDPWPDSGTEKGA